MVRFFLKLAGAEKRSQGNVAGSSVYISGNVPADLTGQTMQTGMEEIVQLAINMFNYFLYTKHTLTVTGMLVCLVEI